MNIKKLDILLRNKLPWLESEVHEDELRSIFRGMGLERKRRATFYSMLIGVATISVTVACYLFFPNSGDSHLQPGQTTGSPNTAYHEPGNSKAGKTPENRGIHDKQGENGSANIVSKNHKYGKPMSEIRQPDKTEDMGSGRTGREMHRSGLKGIHVIHQALPSRSGQSDPEPWEIHFEMNGLKPMKHTYAQFEPGQVDGEAIRPGKNPRRFNLLGQLVSLTRPELSFWVSPMMTAERVAAGVNDESRVHKDFQSKTSGSEKPVVTLNSGVKLQLRILPGINIGTGIGYFQTGYAYAYDYRINNIPIQDSATGKIVNYIQKPDSLSRHIDAKGKHIGKYIEIPLSSRFNIVSRRNLAFGLEPSYTLQVLLKSSGSYVDPVTMELHDGEGYRPRTGNIQLGFPISFGINRHMSFYLTPYYGKALQQVTPVENRQRNYAGIRFAINYKLYNSLK